MVGLSVDSVSAMAQETIWEVGDMLQESMKPDNVSLEVVAWMGAMRVCGEEFGCRATGQEVKFTTRMIVVR